MFKRGDIVQYKPTHTQGGTQGFIVGWTESGGPSIDQETKELGGKLVLIEEVNYDYYSGRFINLPDYGDRPYSFSFDCLVPSNKSRRNVPKD